LKEAGEIRKIAPEVKTVNIRVGADTPEVVRIDSYLAGQARLFTRSQLKRRILSLRVNGKEAKLSRHLRPGDNLEITFTAAAGPAVEPEQIALDILFEDANVLVVNKPQGMVVHPASGNRSGTLVNAILGYCTGIGQRFSEGETRPGIVHRLDKDTSGVIITAKNPDAQEFLAAQFRNRLVDKRYLAVIDGRMPAAEGRIDTRIGRDPYHRQRFTVLPPGASGGRRSVTVYRRLRAFNGFSLVSLQPRTGRTHQLRVHMAYLGCPIVGDKVYGWRRRGGPDRTLMLHAQRLRLRLPGEQQPRTFRAPLPERFRSFLSSTR
jgi:23S rRNA pseudouridine1911/1915/1917 synthase